MKKFLKALFYVIAAVYPILVFTLLVIFKVETKILSLCIVALAAAFFGIILRVVKNVFEQAVALQEENDYTI